MCPLLLGLTTSSNDGHYYGYLFVIRNPIYDLTNFIGTQNQRKSKKKTTTDETKEEVEKDRKHTPRKSRADLWYFTLARVEILHRILLTTYIF